MRGKPIVLVLLIVLVLGLGLTGSKGENDKDYEHEHEAEDYAGSSFAMPETLIEPPSSWPVDLAPA